MELLGQLSLPKTGVIRVATGNGIGIWGYLRVHLTVLQHSSDLHHASLTDGPLE